MRTGPAPPAAVVFCACLSACSLQRTIHASGDASTPPGDSSFDAAFDGDDSAPADVGADADLQVDANAGWALDYTSATFVRPTEASFLLGPPSATGAFLAWAPPDTARFEDRGDGAGPLLLIEGPRTNLVRRSRDLTAPPWSIPGYSGLMVTEDAAPGPDGLPTAHFVTGNGYSPGQPLSRSMQLHTLSAWGRARTASTVWTSGFAYFDQPTAPAWYVTDQSTTWARRSDSVVPATSADYFPIDVSIGPGALDLLLDLHQIEVGAFPSSSIRTDDSTATRAADTMTFPVTSVPPALLTGHGQLSQLSPEFASSDVRVGDEFWILGVGSASGIRLVNDGSGTVIEALVGGVVQAHSAPLTFTPHQLLGAIEWFPTEGRVSVAGAPGPVGAPWTWAPAGLRVGGAVDGGGEAFARLGELSDE